MENLYAACSQLPPDFAKIRSLLENSSYSPEVLSAVMINHISHNCWCETTDFISEHGRYPEVHEIHSSYIYELTKLMLEFGLDPNIITDRSNIVDELELVDYNYTAADTIRMLLEHGGDPNLICDSESLFEWLDSNIILDVSYGFVGDSDDEDSNYLYDWRVYDIKFHIWLVLMAYGGKLMSGAEPVKLKEGLSLSMFRQHENFDYSIEYTKAYDKGWVMHIFNRETKEEVATL